MGDIIAQGKPVIENVDRNIVSMYVNAKAAVTHYLHQARWGTDKDWTCEVFASVLLSAQGDSEQNAIEAMIDKICSRQEWYDYVLSLKK